LRVKHDKKFDSIFKILDSEMERDITIRSKILGRRQDDQGMIETSFKSRGDRKAAGILEI